MEILKKVFIGILILVGLMIVSVIIFMITINKGKQEVLNTKINEVKLENKTDGTYNGSFDGYRWSNKVRVTVNDYKIIDISIVSPMTFRSEEFESQIIKRIIDNQTTKVDVIAGATISSKAILKAVENALSE